MMVLIQEKYPYRMKEREISVKKFTNSKEMQQMKVNDWCLAARLTKALT